MVILAFHPVSFMHVRGSIRPRAIWPFGLFQSFGAASPGGTLAHSQAWPADVPQDPSQFYGGTYHLGGITLRCDPRQVFARADAPPAWRSARDDLGWLSAFADKPRLLHAHYLASLFPSWLIHSRASGSSAQEVQKLQILSRLKDAYAAFEVAALDDVLAQALVLQCRRCLTGNYQSPLAQGLALIAVLQAATPDLPGIEPAALWRKLERALDQLLQIDGSPAGGNLAEGLAMAQGLHRLLSLPATKPMPGKIPAALDRLLGFFAMFQGVGDLNHLPELPQNWGCLEAAIRDTPAIRQAEEGRTARQAEGELAVVTHWSASGGLEWLHAAHKGQALLTRMTAGCAGPAEKPSIKRIGDAARGDLLSLAWREAAADIYLSPKGDDFRVDERVAPESRQTLRLKLGAHVKALVARSGAGAQLILPNGETFALCLRGASLAESDTQGELLIHPSAEVQGPVHFNWALKRHSKAEARAQRARRNPSPTPSNCQLPFDGLNR